jgi:endonuclease/exonuclease/phosphatase family metal-dependent hydrolase
MPALKLLRFAVLIGLVLCGNTHAEPLKAMSWNIKWFPGGHPEATETEKAEHIRSAGEVLKKADPDIFLGQEIRDEKSFNLLAKSSPELKLHVITKFLEFESKTPAPLQCLIASKLELHSASQETFKPVRNVSGVQRGFAFAALKHPDGGLIMVYCIHLRSNRGSEDPEVAKNIAAIRRESVKQILAHRDETAKKFADQKIVGWIVGGDFNSNHDGQFPLCTAIKDMTKAGFHNSWDKTEPEDRLTWRNNPKFEDFKPTTFDYILTSGFQKTQATLFPNVSLRTSDHAPVLLELNKP